MKVPSLSAEGHVCHSYKNCFLSKQYTKFGWNISTGSRDFQKFSLYFYHYLISQEKERLILHPPYQRIYCFHSGLNLPLWFCRKFQKVFTIFFLPVFPYYLPFYRYVILYSEKFKSSLFIIQELFKSILCQSRLETGVKFQRKFLNVVNITIYLLSVLGEVFSLLQRPIRRMWISHETGETRFHVNFTWISRFVFEQTWITPTKNALCLLLELAQRSRTVEDEKVTCLTRRHRHLHVLTTGNEQFWWANNTPSMIEWLSYVHL